MGGLYTRRDAAVTSHKFACQAVRCTVKIEGSRGGREKEIARETDSGNLVSPLISGGVVEIRRKTVRLALAAPGGSFVYFFCAVESYPVQMNGWERKKAKTCAMPKSQGKTSGGVISISTGGYD